MKKIVTSATVAALGLSALVAPQAAAEYTEQYSNGTCTIQVKQADQDAINAYLASPTDSANNLAKALQAILLKEKPDQAENIKALEEYRAKYPEDAILGLTLIRGGVPLENKKQDLIKAVGGLTYEGLTFKGGDARWFVKGPEKATEPVTFDPISLSDAQVAEVLSSGDVSSVAPQNAELKKKIDEHYKEETADLDNLGAFYSDSVKAVSETLKDNAEKERDRASKALGTHSLKTALENCQYLSQGKDPEDERQTGSSEDMEIIRPIAYIFAGVTGLAMLLTIAYGWVREHQPQLLGM
ncbi:hypothetical protein I6I10_03620 [Corynebacterium glucuronolyticum]|uniref:Uncharacterized protein n=1 Tax=Corynebacterium glucuronolyticum TaxID=39791 RepID=A0A7T4EGM4_9CORY|nr:hypothetical protein [Corynebacterium glucuronolyticum]QQB47016.1 hypothetical protein I6I10_03620 [Corynebacterium glucuronolyticum]WKD64693.1 hypothetical protein CGLUCO_12390 [Corynebacterium glucuronolyticum DSM 44120]SMB82166.1 hypothetical protein SAMN05660745_02573 [Corynebacterium glucuronolyticum]